MVLDRYLVHAAESGVCFDSVARRAPSSNALKYDDHRDQMSTRVEMAQQKINIARCTQDRAFGVFSVAGEEAPHSQPRTKAWGLLLPDERAHWAGHHQAILHQPAESLPGRGVRHPVGLVDGDDGGHSVARSQLT